MVQTNVVAHNIEIRGCEKKTSAKGNEYLIVHCDDEHGKRSDFMDKDLEREQYYKRGTIGDLTLKLDIGKYSNIEIIDFKITEKEA